MVDNSDNEHILSDKDMFTDKIDPTISNVVSNIGEKILFQNVFAQYLVP